MTSSSYRKIPAAVSRTNRELGGDMTDRRNHEILDPVENLARTIDRLNATEPRVRAWQQVDETGALKAAKALSERHGEIPDGPLRGITVGIKDVIDVAGLPTKAGSKARANAGPATADAKVVERLRLAGVIVLGKVKTTEFAYTDPTDTANPANLAHTPGGSSSGSAAAIAAGSADLTLGTQTVGSVCRPAAYCGVAAFKPSIGATPLAGVAPLAPSFDTVGFFARDIRLAIAAYQCCTAQPVLPQSRASSPSRNEGRWKGIRVGTISDAYYETDAEMGAALRAVETILKRGGAELVVLATGTDFQAMREHQRTMMFFEAARAHGALLDEAELLGPNWRAGLEQGVRTSDLQYCAARDSLADARNQLAAAWCDEDFMLLPPTRSPAPEGLHSTGDAGLIVPWTIAGSPLAVLPVGRTQLALPTAVMIAGKPWTDGRTAAFAIQLQDQIALDCAPARQQA
jgi:aspartyl-tRNA(Asn)/glutamyl-tRNA(Gln) amidotransferase subunit A